MMRKSMWIIPLLLLSAAIGSTTAYADSFDYYSISFSGANAPTAAVGTVLTYDATTQEFTSPNFSLTYEGSEYTEHIAPTPDAFNPPTGDQIEWVTAGPTASIVIFDETAGDALYVSGPTSPVATAGLGLVTLSAVPEIDPQNATSALALLIGAVLIIRGRRRKMAQPESGCERA